MPGFSASQILIAGFQSGRSFLYFRSFTVIAIIQLLTEFNYSSWAQRSSTSVSVEDVSPLKSSPEDACWFPTVSLLAVLNHGTVVPWRHVGWWQWQVEIVVGPDTMAGVWQELRNTSLNLFILTGSVGSLDVYDVSVLDLPFCYSVTLCKSFTYNSRPQLWSERVGLIL